MVREVVTKNTIPDEKLYELIVLNKNHLEDKREDINKHYTSLFTIGISIMAFCNKTLSYEWDIEKIELVFLPAFAIILLISWISTLKRIKYALQGLENLLNSLEQKHDKTFNRYMTKYLREIEAPRRITEQEMMIPYTLLVFFIIVLGYFCYLCIFQL